MMNSSQHLPCSNCTSLASVMAPHYRSALDIVYRFQMPHDVGFYASTNTAIAWTASNLSIYAIIAIADSPLPDIRIVKAVPSVE